MTGNHCCGYWYSNLTTAQWNDAFSLGWSLSATVRTSGTTGFGYLVLDVPGGSGLNRFDISFGNDGTNGWAGLNVWSDAANPALKTIFSGNSFHLLDMRWDPTTQSASLFVDGVQTLSGYTGHGLFREGHGPIWGVTGNTTLGLFRDVTFSINDPAPQSGVPEPSAVLLTAAGLLLVLRRASLS